MFSSALLPLLVLPVITCGMFVRSTTRKHIYIKKTTHKHVQLNRMKRKILHRIGIFVWHIRHTSAVRCARATDRSNKNSEEIKGGGKKNIECMPLLCTSYAPLSRRSNLYELPLLLHVGPDRQHKAFVPRTRCLLVVTLTTPEQLLKNSISSSFIFLLFNIFFSDSSSCSFVCSLVRSLACLWLCVCKSVCAMHLSWIWLFCQQFFSISLLFKYRPEA